MRRAIQAGASRRRGVALVASIALVLTLVLAGCGGRGAHGQNNYGSGGTSAGISSTSSAGDTTQVRDADAQVQNALGGLDDAENSATSAESTSQEGTTLP